MTDRTVRFIRGVRFILHDCSLDQLYQVSLALRDECARRDLDCGPESKALTAALLVHAQAEHGAIFSADCGEVPRAYYSRRSPDRPAPAES